MLFSKIKFILFNITENEANKKNNETKVGAIKQMYKAQSSKQNAYVNGVYMLRLARYT